MNKQESKYFYTASLMDEALLLLLEKKDFEYITVKELCQKAGVNRTTFYLHYQNMNELLEETINELNKKFLDSFSKEMTIEKALNEDKVLTTSKYLVPYLNFIKDNKKAFKLASTKPLLFKSDKAFKKLNENIFEPVLDRYGVKEDEKQYILAFYVKGVFSIILKWLDNNCSDDVELIVNIIEKVTLVK